MPQGWLGVVQLLQWRGKKRGERHIENWESLHITLIMYLITVNIRFVIEGYTHTNNPTPWKSNNLAYGT